MMVRRSLALLLLLVVPSCSRQSPLTTQPEPAASALRTDAGIARSQLDREPGDYYPLAVGNQWTYEFKNIREFLASDNSVIERTEEAFEQYYSIDCSLQSGDHEWFIQRIRHPGGTNILRALYQDRTGLHGLEWLNPADPCAAGLVAGQVKVEELRYPLRRGSTWIFRDQPTAPPTVARVEGHEVIETPAGRFPAVRLRIKAASELAGETYFAWYGREGLLAIENRWPVSVSGTTGRRYRDILDIRLKSMSRSVSLASKERRTAAITPGRSR